MRKTFIITFFFLTWVLHGGNLTTDTGASAEWEAVFDTDTIRWALAQIESGHLKNPDAARGASGEVSRFQIMPKVWRDYSPSRSFRNASVAWSVAEKILKDRHGWFVRSTGKEPSPFDLYVMWNKPGLYARVDFEPRRLPRWVRDVATRFENLVESFESERVIAVRSE